jgi:hypothetical protein
VVGRAVPVRRPVDGGAAGVEGAVVAGRRCSTLCPGRGSGAGRITK